MTDYRAQAEALVARWYAYETKSPLPVVSKERLVAAIADALRAAAEQAASPLLEELRQAQKRLNYYESVLTIGWNGPLIALPPDSLPTPAVSEERVAEVLRERDELRHRRDSERHE